MALGIGTVYLVIIALLIGWFYLLLYQTATALRIAGGVFTVIIVIGKGLFRVIASIFGGLYNLIGGRRR